MEPSNYRDVKRRAIGGVAWQLLGNGLGQVGQLFVLVALARFLRPSDFGIVGMSSTVVAFMGLLASSGLSTSLVQKESAEKEDIHAVFTSSMVLTLISCSLVYWGAPAISWFFDQGDQLVRVVRVSVITILLAPLTTIPKAVLQRRMMYRRIALADTLSKILSGVTAVIMAWKGFGYWSLVFRPIVSALISICILIRGTGMGFSFRGVWMRVLDMFRFAKDVTLFEIFNYWTENVDYLLIGKFLGPHALGVYTMAYNLATLFNRKVTGLFSAISFSAFSRLHSNVELVRSAFVKAVSAVASTLSSGLIFLALTAGAWVQCLYGAKWGDAALPLALLAVAAIFHGITFLYGGLFLGTGRADLRLRFGIVSFMLQVAFIGTAILLLPRAWTVAAAIGFQSLIIMVWGWTLVETIIGSVGLRYLSPLMTGVPVALFAFLVFRLCEGLGSGPIGALAAGSLAWALAAFFIVTSTELPGASELRGCIRQIYPSFREGVE